MPVKVVDASALGALLFEEAEADLIGDRLDGASLAAPALLWFELANVCLKKLRREPARHTDLLRAFSFSDCMDIATHAVDHADALSLAQRLGLTTYDASYLWLAKRLGAELVTLDQQLARAIDHA